MSKDFLGRGWSFPVAADAAGRVRLSEYEEDVRESIHLILMTAKGERVMRPDFGSGLYDFVFASMSVTVMGSIQAAVKDALVQWEPRAQVLSVNVEADEGEIGRLNIDVEYRVRATNNRFNLVFPFYLRERT
jgi:phage baseplate assembly protein W